MIPNEAVEAAAVAMARVLDEGLEPPSYVGEARYVLEAAAPHMHDDCCCCGVCGI